MTDPVFLLVRLDPADLRQVREFLHAPPLGSRIGDQPYYSDGRQRGFDPVGAAMQYGVLRRAYEVSLELARRDPRAERRELLPPNYVREIGPDDAWASSPPPDGYRRVIVDATHPAASDLGWEVNAAPGRRCRYTVPAPDRPSNRQGCGRPAVVVLYRGAGHTRPYGYCNLDEHLFGRHWDSERGRLLSTTLVGSGS